MSPNRITEDELELGRINYEAQRAKMLSLAGRVMPEWDSLDGRSKRCHLAGAMAVVRAVSSRVAGGPEAAGEAVDGRPV